MSPIKLVFLAGARPLTKIISPDGVQPYPMLRRKTSHERLIHSIEDFHRALNEHASQGHCLYMGLLSEPIVDESRAGKTLDTNRRWIALDFDKIEYQTHGELALSASDVARVAETALSMLPDYFKGVSYIAHASSSMGLGGTTASVHLLFLLDNAVSPRAVKKWIAALNFSSETLSDQIRLTKTGWGLSYRLDPVVNDNARELFIAPPTFERMESPFGDDADRIVLIKKERDQLPSDVIQAPEEFESDVAKKIKKLRRAAGMSSREQAKYRTLTIDGFNTNVLLNPTPGILTLAYEKDEFCYYNLNGGNSRAYYHRVGKPDIIYNFKGEPPFRWVDVDPEGYREYCRQNASLIREKSPVRAFMVLDHQDGTAKRVYHNIETDEAQVFSDVQGNAEVFYAQHGQVAPPNLEYWRLVSDPQADFRVDYSTKTINTFRGSRLLHRPGVIADALAADLRYGNAELIKEVCPHIWNILTHVMADGLTEVNHFINWLAYIFQKRDKAETAWIWQGTPGTGKGVFLSKVLRPLFGEHAVAALLAPNCSDNFNQWREGCLIAVVDEFEAQFMREDSKLGAKFKAWITESVGPLRKMRQDLQQARFYDNFLFFSNKRDIIVLERGDRRFNVAPRQEVKLRSRYPDTVKAINDGTLDAEVASFAGVLAAWTVDEAAARVPLENEAKYAAHEAAASNSDEFCDALIDGDLSAFVHILSHQTTGRDDILQVELAKKTVRRWVAECGGPLFATTSELTAVYNVFAGLDLTPAKASRVFSKRGLVQRRTNLAKGFELHFRPESLDKDTHDAVDALPGNVIPIKGVK